MAMTQDFNFKDQSHDLSPESKGAPWGEIIRDYEPLQRTHWRFGKPNYARVNKAYFAGRTKVHPEGSLESVVSKLVKNWEVETHHIYDIKDWQTVDIKQFQASLNGGQCVSAQVMADAGPYNVLVGDVDGYKGSKNTFESANEIFSSVFTEGFAWEVLEVYSPPPEVAFKWRHFGKFTGKYIDEHGEEHPGNNKLIEVFGACIAKVSADLKIENLKIYYDPNSQIQPLMTNRHAKSMWCPFSCRQDDDEEESEEEAEKS